MKNLVIIICFICLCNLNAQVGINTTTPQSTLDINGNLSVKHVSIVGSGNTTPNLINDGVYISVTPTTSFEQFQLPDPRDVPGRVYILRNVTNSTWATLVLDTTVTADGVLFFAGNSTTGTSTIFLSANSGSDNKTLLIISDGTNWTYGEIGF